MKQSPIKTPSTLSSSAAQAVVDRLNAKEKIVREVFAKKDGRIFGDSLPVSPKENPLW